MKNLFIISESERERILGIHENATKNQYLSEQKKPLNTPEDIAKTIRTAASGMFGVDTYDDLFMSAISAIKSVDTFNKVNGLLGNNGLQGILNNEYKPSSDGEDQAYLSKMKEHLGKYGINLSYSTKAGGDGNIKIAATTQTQNNPDTSSSLKGSVESDYYFSKNDVNKQSSDKQNSSQVTNKKVDYSPRINKIQTTLGITNPSGKIDVATVDALINKIKQS